MMVEKLLSFALVASATSVCLAGTANAENSTPSVESSKDEVVCKREARTNSRFQSKVCNTRKQWEQIEEASKRSAREMIDRPVFETRKD